MEKIELLDYFAGIAFAELIKNWGEQHIDDIAAKAYLAADRMLQARDNYAWAGEIATNIRE